MPVMFYNLYIAVNYYGNHLTEAELAGSLKVTGDSSTLQSFSPHASYDENNTLSEIRILHLHLQLAYGKWSLTLLSFSYMIEQYRGL